MTAHCATAGAVLQFYGYKAKTEGRCALCALRPLLQKLWDDAAVQALLAIQVGRHSHGCLLLASAINSILVEPSFLRLRGRTGTDITVWR